MTTLLDAGQPPSRFLSGQPWAGYLASPTVYHQPGRPGVPFWTRTHLEAAMHAGGLLPVYVAPLTRDGFHARHGAADAADALRQVRALTPDRLVVALDMESRAYAAAPGLAITYAVDFARAAHVAGAVTAHYGPRSWLHDLRPHLADTGQLIAWLAWWTDVTTWPLPAWPEPHAWQYDHDKPMFGTSVDVSRIAGTLPLCRPGGAIHNPTTYPPAVHDPHDVTMAAAVRAWLTAKGL